MASVDFYELIKLALSPCGTITCAKGTGKQTHHTMYQSLNKGYRYQKIIQQLQELALGEDFVAEFTDDFCAALGTCRATLDTDILEDFFLKKDPPLLPYVEAFSSCRTLPREAREALADLLSLVRDTVLTYRVDAILDRLEAELQEARTSPSPAPAPTANEKADELPPRSPLASPESTPAVDTDEFQKTAETIKDVFAEFGILLTYAGHTQGARVTRYEFAPKAGIRMARIVRYAGEIGEALGAFGVRIEAPIPNRTVIGVEIPRTDTDIVRLASLLEGDAFREAESKTTVALGTDLAGEAVLFDVAKAPHTLIAGAVGTGKSVCLNSILISLLEKATPDELRLILIDPKRVEFNVYSRVPHLLMPVIGDTARAAGALNWAVQEMERRYNLIEAAAARDIRSYNEYCKGAGLPPLPRLLIVVDELHDLMVSHRKAVESAICRIAQKSRAAGIHLVLATQRPSVTVFTQDIKINIPARIALRVCSYADSRTILDMSGAERLLPCGDMLFSPMGTPMRMQCAFVSDEEIREGANRAVEAYGTAQFDDAVLSGVEREAESVESAIVEEEYVLFQETRRDPKFEQAIDVAFAAGNVSTSLLQRKLGIGFGKAARFIDVMHELGIVGETVASARPRELLITREEYEKRKTAADT